MSLAGLLQAHCRTVAGTAGTFNEDLYAALCVMQGFSLDNGRSLSGLLALIPGGLPALLLNPTLITGGPSGSFSLDFSLPENSMYIVLLLNDD